MWVCEYEWWVTREDGRVFLRWLPARGISVGKSPTTSLGCHQTGDSFPVGCLKGCVFPDFCEAFLTSNLNTHQEHS